MFIDYTIYGDGASSDKRRGGTFRMVFTPNDDIVYDETTTTDTTGDTSAIVLEAVASGGSATFRSDMSAGFGDDAVIVYMYKLFANQ
jgi:hypothetical protein